MGDRYDISVDIGDGKDWWYVHGLTTHDKVYELNRQMCDLGKTMSDPMKSLSEDTERAMLGCCELLAKDASDAKWMMDDIVRRAEENIRLYNDNNKYARFVRAAYESKFGKPKEKDIMEEKKTKKMTKAEAFEYLKHKKVAVTRDTITLQNKLFNIGYKWCDGSIEAMPMIDFLLIDDETFQFTESLSHFRKCGYTEISADDILSIEIVEENRSEDELVEIVELGKKIQSLLPKFSGHRHVVITEDDIILREEGMCLFHSDPF